MSSVATPIAGAARGGRPPRAGERGGGPGPVRGAGCPGRRGARHRRQHDAPGLRPDRARRGRGDPERPRRRPRGRDARLELRALPAVPGCRRARRESRGSSTPRRRRARRRRASSSAPAAAELQELLRSAGPLPVEHVETPGAESRSHASPPSGRARCRRCASSASRSPSRTTSRRSPSTETSLGLPVRMAWDEPTGKGTILEAGGATLELLSARSGCADRRVEVGRRIAGPVRLALEVEDSARQRQSSWRAARSWWLRRRRRRGAT